MAKKVKVDTPNVKVEKEGKKLTIDIDTKNVDVKIVKDELNKEFHLDTKNIDIDIEKNPEGLEIKVEAKKGIWTLIANKIIKFIVRRFK